MPRIPKTATAGSRSRNSPAAIGEEFQIVVSHDSRGMDLLTIVAEPRPDVGQDTYPGVAREIENEISSRCELRPVVDLLPYGTLPRTEFKAKRVKDLRNQPST
jgi:phenylacetate-CoA ligase